MKTTTLTLNEEDVQTAKELGINISKEVRNYIRILIDRKTKPLVITPDVEIEIQSFIDMIKNEDDEFNLKDNWRAYVNGRSKVITNRTGKDVSPVQLREIIEKRLKE